MDLKRITLEFKNFCKLFYYFTVSMKILEQLEGEISIFDVLNHYRMKTLKNEDIEAIKDVKLYEFGLFKGLNTDLVFVTFKIRPLHLNRIKAVFNPSDRSFRRYKTEFTKTERTLLFKLKSNNEYEYNHRDYISNSMQLDLNGKIVYSPFEQTYENSKQTFESEYEFKTRKKREKWSEIKEKQAMRADARKALWLWRKIKMPRLPRPEKTNKKEITVNDLKKQRGWRTGQKRELLGFLYINIYGNLDKNLTVAPIKIPQSVKPQKTVFISTEKMEEKEKKALW